MEMNRMDNIAALKDALRLRMYGNPDEYYEVTLWQSEVDAICADLPASINFILSEYTDEELYWLGEVFEDIADRTRSAAFVDCLKKRVQGVENPEWKQTLLEEIRAAAEYIDA